MQITVPRALVTSPSVMPPSDGNGLPPTSANGEGHVEASMGSSGTYGEVHGEVPDDTTK